MGLGQLFEVGSVALLECRESIRTAECFVHSITQNKKIGRPLLDEVFHVLGVALQPQAVPHLITGPGKAANLQALVSHGNLHAGFHFPMFKQTFDHGVAIEEQGGIVLWAWCVLGFRKRGVVTKNGKSKKNEKNWLEGHRKQKEMKGM